MVIEIGEQGGDPTSIGFCYRIGLDYVSCSPFRIPVVSKSGVKIKKNKTKKKKKSKGKKSYH